MSQQRATEQNAASNNNNSEVITLDDDDDEDGDVQFLGAGRPIATIDLCLSPSTSAAAAARSGNGPAGDTGTGSGSGSGSGAAAVALDPNSTTMSSGHALKTSNQDAATGIAGGDSPSASASALECPICLQTCIHPARLPCGHIFCFLCVKGVAYKNRRCAMCRREIPAEFLDHPQLVNGIEDICTTRATEDGYQWYYEGRNGGWWAYDSRTNGDIETAYADYQVYKKANLSHPSLATPPAERAAEDHLPNQDHPSMVNVIEIDEDDLAANSPADRAAGDHVPNQDHPNMVNVIEIEEDDLAVNSPAERAAGDHPNIFNVSEIDEDEIMLYQDWDLDFDDSDEDFWAIDSDSDTEDPPDFAPHPGRLQVLICGNMYIIDFMQMRQYPRSTPEKRRNILRCKSTDDVPGGTMGVAGLRKHLRYNQP